MHFWLFYHLAYLAHSAAGIPCLCIWKWLAGAGITYSTDFMNQIDLSDWEDIWDQLLIPAISIEENVIGLVIQSHTVVVSIPISDGGHIWQVLLAKRSCCFIQMSRPQADISQGQEKYLLACNLVRDKEINLYCLILPVCLGVRGKCSWTAWTIPSGILENMYNKIVCQVSRHIMKEKYSEHTKSIIINI